MGIKMVTATVLGAEKLAPEQPAQLEPRVTHLMNAALMMSRLLREGNLGNVVVWHCSDEKIVVVEGGATHGTSDSHTLTPDGRTGASDMAELAAIVTVYAKAYKSEYPIPFRNFSGEEWNNAPL